MNARERNDLIISWVTLSIAFTLVISDSLLSLMSLAEALPIALIGVGSGFIFHELAHRNVARHFGYHAEFRAWMNGLILAVVFAVVSFGRFTFAAPGATYIFAHAIPRDQNGKISIAGPVTNIIIGFIFMIVSLFVADKFVFNVLFNAGWINFFLAGFNLLPIGPLDGRKVMNWSMAAWLITIGVAGTMILFPQIFYIGTVIALGI